MTDKAIAGTSIEVRLTEADFDSATKKRIGSRKAGSRVLADADGDPKSILSNALPAVIAKKIESMIPPDFSLVEVQMKVTLTGKVFGSGITGEALVKFAPKKST